MLLYKNKTKEVKMKSKLKKTLAMLLCILTLTILPITQLGAAAADTDTLSYLPNVTVYLGGNQVLNGDAKIIDDVTYVSLRSFCDLIGGCELTWDARTRTATVRSGTTEIISTTGDYYIYANERCLYTVTPIRIIDNRMWVPIRPIAKALGVEVEWDGTRRAVILTKTGKQLEHANTFYDNDELYWLSRIISAESKGEPLKGQIAVGNVVLNRVRHKSYPNTIYGVIFDRKNGTQFSPVSFGTIYNKPSASAIIAAKICLEGYSISNDILFFMNPRIATSNWISQNRPFAFRIGNHDFYY